MTRGLAAVVAAALAAFGCSEPGTGASGADAGATADVGAGPAGAFEVAVLDPDAKGSYPVSIASSGDRVGVAYFAETGGTPAIELRYVEPGSAPERVAGVDLVFGVSLAFDAAGNPHIAYLGGESDRSVFWKQSDVALATRGPNGWTTEILARTSGEAASGVETSDFGVVVGLWPALLAMPGGDLFLAYRDVHGGQFPTDWEHADVEFVQGRPGAWASPAVAALGGNDLKGHGGLLAAVLAGEQPALAWSAQTGSATDTPRDVWFAGRSATGWSQPQLLASAGDTGTGPALAWSAASGFGIAFEDRARGVLSFLESADGSDWKAPEPIHGSGTGGWNPGVGFGPDGEPVVAYYVCSAAAGATSCRASDDELVIKRRAGGRWPSLAVTVDAEGGLAPRIAFAGSRAVIAYKDLSGPGATPRALKLARER